MKESFTKENIYSLISNLKGFERVNIIEKDVAYKLVVSSINKSVSITWPYELGEVFLDYIEDEIIIFQDWFDCLDSDEVKDFINYIDDVAKRYVFNETRIHRKCFIFRSNELQYYSKGEWLNVLHP